MNAKTKAICVVCILLFTAFPLGAQQPLPAPWKDQDIGAAKIPGKAGEAAGVFTVQGTMDIWGVADGSHLIWQPGHGDVELVARVTSMENPGGVNHAKASLCIRESLDPGARQVTLCVTPGDGTQFIYRKEANAKDVRIFPTPEALKAGVPKGQFPCWLKLVRHGNTFTGYESPDGEKWQVSAQIDLDLPPETVVGLATSSHKPDILTKAVFDHVTMSRQPTTVPTNR
jgi:hypothetical protein